MKLFLEIMLVLVALVLSECRNPPKSKPEPEQSRNWPYVKKKFPYPVQSPVNIISSDAKNKKLSPLKINFPSNSKQEIAVVENTGYLFEVLLPEKVKNRPIVTGGPLFKDKYIFEQFHFHWGKTSKCGSENRIDGKCFSTEVHAVFYNAIYGSLKEAASNKHPDGVAVVALFGKQNSKNTDNPDLKNLISNTSKIIQPKTNTTISFESASKFLTNIIRAQKKYYTFPGSLTTPQFYECVTWIVFPQPFIISSTQVGAFRKLIGTYGKPVKENVRPLQNFNNRPLLMVQSFHSN